MIIHSGTLTPTEPSLGESLFVSIDCSASLVVSRLVISVSIILIVVFLNGPENNNTMTVIANI